MKIILINYRFFVTSGPERYMFNLTELFTRKGHTVIPFSIKSPLNEPSPYEGYFLEKIEDGKQIYFNQYDKRKIKTIVNGLSRMWYSFEAKKKLEVLIEEVKPDLIYVLFYQNKISMSIFDAARKKKIPIVHRISDFGLVCARQIFYRPDTKSVCEKCLHGSKVNAIIHKCVYDSYVYSFIKVVSLKIQQVLQLTNKIDAFVLPSNFTLSKMAEAGIPIAKLHHIPTFFNFNVVDKSLAISYTPFALYIGRIEEEKGLLTMIKAFVDTPFHLKIIGFSQSGYETVLKNYLKDKKHNIEFLGKKNFSEIQTCLQSCLFTIVPSEMYDNLPNTILESFAFRKCVLTTDNASFREIIGEKRTGIMFNAKDVADLKIKLVQLFGNPELCMALGNNAYENLLSEFSELQHYEKLMGLFNSLIELKKAPLLLSA